jgi:hypothetical protein
LTEMMIDLSEKEKPAAPVSRLCKDCRWGTYDIIPPPNEAWTEFEKRLARDPSYEPPRMWLCNHPSSSVAAEPDYVNGEPSAPRQLACQSARSRMFDNRCGPEGRYWEPRNERC